MMAAASSILPGDPHDFLDVLRALRAYCNAHLVGVPDAPGAAGWQVAHIEARPDGEGWLSLRSARGTQRLRWGAPPPPAPAAGEDPGGAARKPPEGAWSWGRLSAPAGVPDGVRVRVAQALRAALARPEFALLRYVNRGVHRFWYDDGVVDRLLAGRFAVDHTRYGDAVLAGIQQEDPAAFDLTFSRPGGAVRFRVAAPGLPAPDGAEVVLTHPLFTLLLLQDSRDARARRTPSHQVERLVGFVLCRGVHRGMRLEAGDVAAGGLGPDHFGDPRAVSDLSLFGGAPVSTSRWGNSLQWHQFFSDFEIARGGLCSLQYRDAVAAIVHGEPECQMVEPTALPRRWTHSAPPWRAGSSEPPAGSRALTSLLGEREALFGGTPQLAEALEAAAATPTVDLVLLNDTCLSRITGDDVASEVARVQARSRVPVVWMDTDRGDPDEVYADLVAQWCAGITPAAREAADAVGMFGYPAVPARRELEALLAAVGIRVSGHLVPELGRGLVTAYLGGCAQVVYPWEPVQAVHARLFAAVDLPQVSVPAPYGLADTRAWLFGIAEALGRDDAAAAWWEGAAAARLREALVALREQAAQVRIAVVVRCDEVMRVIAAERCYGVRLLPLLAELGFGLDAVLVAPQPGEGARSGAGEAAAASLADAEAALRAALGGEADLRVHPADSPAALESVLRDGAFHAVYTEVTGDARVTRAGKVPVHLSQVEMGLAGAVRTARRLVHLGRWPFLRRYRRYFPVSPEVRHA